jgi:hypothetical protein
MRARLRSVTVGRPCFAGCRISMIAALLLTACGESAPAATAAEPVVRASAGITIVENPDPDGVDLPVWRLSAEPIVEIGTIDGPDPYQFHQVVSALRRAGDTIAVLDRGSAEIRFFDPKGRHVRTAGGAGEGPGELLHPVWMHPIRGDSLAVWQWNVMRLSFLGRDGAYGRTVQIISGDPGVLASPRGILRDGSTLAVMAPASEPQRGVVRDSAAYARFDPEGAFAGEVAWAGSAEMFGYEHRGRLQRTLRAFAGPGAFAVGHDRLHLADTHVYEIRSHAADGALRRIVRIDRPPRPVTAADRDAWRDDRLDGAEGAHRARIRDELAAMPFPDRMPAIANLVADRAGRLWVRRYAPPYEEARVWDVVGADGRLEAILEMPSGLTVREIGNDYLLAVWRDDLDVEYVLMYGVERRRQ